jgi:hypothetical protein
MSDAAFIVYRDLLIYPTTDDEGRHYAEIIGTEGEDLRDAATAPLIDSREEAVRESMTWIDRRLAKAVRS